MTNLPVDPNQNSRQIEDGSFVSVGDRVVAAGMVGTIKKFGGDCVFVRVDGDTFISEYDISEIEQLDQ